MTTLITRADVDVAIHAAMAQPQADDLGENSARESSPAVSPVRATLAALNARTRYRFTGIYRAAPPMLENVCLFDRENPTLNLGGDIHIFAETYCSIVYLTACGLEIVNARTDGRFRGHPAAARFVSYCGVPIHIDGAVRGILCHFDARPRMAPDGELAYLKSLNATLGGFLQVAPSTAPPA